MIYTTDEKEFYERRIVAVQTLVGTEGWKLLKETLEMTYKSAFQGLTDLKTEPHLMAKHAGVLKAIEDVLSWPEREVTVCRNALQEALGRQDRHHP